MSKDYTHLNRGLVLSYFWKVIRQFPRTFYSVTFLTILVGVLDVYIPFQFLKLWNILSGSMPGGGEAARNVILTILGWNILRHIFRRYVTFANDYFQAGVMAGLRHQAFSYMIGHSHAFFASSFGGSLVQKVNKYARSFEKLMDKFVTEGLPLFVKSIGTVVAVYTLNEKYALIIGIFCFAFIITGFIYTRFKLKYDVIAAESDTHTTGALADSITNHASIELFTGHTYERARVGDVINEQRQATVFNWYLWDGLNAIQATYIIITEFVLFWIAIGDWEIGFTTVAVFMLLQTYFVRLAENLWNFSSLVRAFYDSFADAQEMVQIFEKPYSVSDVRGASRLGKVSGAIEFKNVTYHYETNNHAVIEDLSITIPKGQKVALVGTSGAGKSTFVRLIMRLFDVSSGVITIDGTDIRTVTQESLREQIAFVPQDPVLFHRTLTENIRYGRRDASDAEVREAARLAHCDEFIDRLPLGYDTYVGERGIKLSGGERQRIAIARAILKNAPILVLDEATSSLDSHSEVLIQDALRTLIQGKTTIVIAHRLSTIREMDRIVVMEHGKILEEGTHASLLRKRGSQYKKLWEIQASGFSKKEAAAVV
jgi:ATP-binding cassette subfamily B protein